MQTNKTFSCVSVSEKRTATHNYSNTAIHIWCFPLIDVFFTLCLIFFLFFFPQSFTLSSHGFARIVCSIEWSVLYWIGLPVEVVWMVGLVVQTSDLITHSPILVIRSSFYQRERGRGRWRHSWEEKNSVCIPWCCLQCVSRVSTERALHHKWLYKDTMAEKWQYIALQVLPGIDKNCEQCLWAHLTQSNWKSLRYFIFNDW